MAEWLRRWTANPLGCPRQSSNLCLIEIFSFFVYCDFNEKTLKAKNKIIGIFNAGPLVDYLLYVEHTYVDHKNAMYPQKIKHLQRF